MADFRLHKRQGKVFLSEAEEILYGGAAGGGKSHLLRMLAISLCSQVPGLQCYLFRRKSVDLYKNHFAGPTGFPSLLASYISAGMCRIVNSPTLSIKFNHGATIMACHCQYEKDLQNYQGAEMHLLLFDELTHFTETQYRFLRSRCRASDSLVIPEALKKTFPGLKIPKIVSGANPGGPGHNWVKKAFVTSARPEQIWRAPVEDGGKLRQFIPAKLTDNPSLNAEEYANNLKGLGAEWLVKAMLDGNWDITSGGALDDLWAGHIHSMPKFKIPSSWYVDRTFDWGSSKPYACLWFAESDGSDLILPDGTIIPTIPGDLFVIDELYGWHGKDDVGTGETPKEVAKKILERDKELGYDVHDGAADSAIFAESEGRGHSIARSFADEGIYWRPANKAPGSRRGGLVLVRERLKASLQRESEPGLFVFDHCLNFLRTVPVLQLSEMDPEDVDSSQEDHCLHGDTIVHTLEYGPVPIRELAGEKGHCLTAGGYYAKFDNCRLILKDYPTVKITTVDAGCLISSAEHQLLKSDLTFEEAGKWKFEEFRKHNRVLTVKSTINAGSISSGKGNGYILPSGGIITARFLTVAVYIILTVIVQIIKLKICGWLNRKEHMVKFTDQTTETGLSRKGRLRRRKNGMEAVPGGLGTRNTMKGAGNGYIRDLIAYALFAKGGSTAVAPMQNSVATPTNRNGEDCKVATMSRRDAWSVARCLFAINISVGKPAPGVVQTASEIVSIEDNGRADLYCLNVRGTHCLVVNDGLVASNCWDALRYRVGAVRGSKAGFQGLGL